jgi:hypothetical protein
VDLLVEHFIEIRELLIKEIEPSFQVFFSQLWDPACFYIIGKEAKKIYKQKFKEKYPYFPEKFYPQFRFELVSEEDIDISIQEYFNPIPELQYMGTCYLFGHTYDLYIRDRYDMNGPMFIARYGHNTISYISGGSDAKEEFLAGQKTPLASAFQLAVDQNLIEYYTKKCEGDLS